MSTARCHGSKLATLKMTTTTNTICRFGLLACNKNNELGLSFGCN
jgi:hypothetical protein